MGHAEQFASVMVSYLLGVEHRKRLICNNHTLVRFKKHITCGIIRDLRESRRRNLVGVEYVVGEVNRHGMLHDADHHHGEEEHSKGREQHQQEAFANFLQRGNEWYLEKS